MINKNQFRIDSDKKVLHKIGKRWVTVSVAMLALLGGNFAATHKATHAATTPSAAGKTASKTENVNQATGLQKTGINMQSLSALPSAKPAQASSASAKPTKTSAIQSQASNMYRGLVNHRVRGLMLDASEPSTNDMNTLTLGTPAQQKRAWNFAQAGIHGNDYDRTNTSTASAKPVNSTSASAVNNKATSNQTSSAFSASAKVNTNVSASKSQTLHNLGQSLASASANNASASSANRIDIDHNHKHMLGDMMLGAIQDTKEAVEFETSNASPSDNDIEGSAFYVAAPSGATVHFSANNGSLVVTTDNGSKVATFNSDDTATSSVAVPANYSLASNAQSFKVASDSDFSNVPKVWLTSATPNSDSIVMSSDIPVEGNTVTFRGNIVLNFPEKGGNHQIKIPYSINTKVDSRLQDILNGKTYDTNEKDNTGLPNVVIPNPSTSDGPQGYVNQIINHFNTRNFSYTNANSSQSGTYDGVYVQSTDGIAGSPHVTQTGQDSYIYNNPDITFNFTANNVSEHINYQYNGSTIANNPKDTNGNSETNDPSSTVVSGANDTQGSLASNDVPAGWHIASGNSGNNSWTYGNEDTDNPQGTHNVNILPNSASATINYVVSDGSASNSGSTIASSTFSGNDYRATNAGNNAYVINSATATNNNKSGSSSNGLPAGYHVVISDGHGHEVPVNGNNPVKVPYDNNANGNHVIKIQGNMHNPNSKGTTPSSTVPSTNPHSHNYVPQSDMSDVVTVNENEYSNGKFIRTVKQYMAVAGRTGDTYTINPSTFTPNGYQVEGNNSNDNSQQGVITANGLSRPTINFDFDAETGSGITVNYINQNGTNVNTPSINNEISGQSVDVSGNIYTYEPMPKGYHFVSVSGDNQVNNGANSTDSKYGTNIPYTVGTSAQHININVAGNTVTPSTQITPSHPTTPSDNPVTPSKPSDLPTPNINPNNNKKTAPSDNPVVPGHKDSNGKIVPNQTSDIKPDGKNGTPNQPYSNPSDLTPADDKDKNNTFYVVVNDFGYDRTTKNDDKLERQYVKRLTESGQVGNSFNINPSTFQTNGYTANNDKPYKGFFGGNGLLASDNKTPQNSIVWNYTANPQTATITYKDQAGNTEPITISGHTDSDIHDVTNPQDGGHQLPQGYHKTPGTNYNYQFNGPLSNPNQPTPTTYAIEGNTISGKYIVHLDYRYGHNSTYDNGQANRTDAVSINKHVGDKPLVVSPENPKYIKSGFHVGSGNWTIHFNASDKGISGDTAANGNINDFEPSDTFTYIAQHAHINVTYVDVSNGAQPDPKYGNQTVSFEKNNYPIVGHQSISDTGLGVAGQVVNLHEQGTGTNKNTPTDWYELVAPKGFYFVHTDDNDRALRILGSGVQMFSSIKLGTMFTVHMNHKPNKNITIMLGSSAPAPKPAPKPVKPANVSDGSIQVQYVDHGKVVSDITTTKKAGTPFDVSNYISGYVPQGYNFDSIENAVDDYSTTPQVVRIDVSKASGSIIPSDNVVPSSANSSAKPASANSASVVPSSASAPSSSAAKPNSAKSASNSSAEPVHKSTANHSHHIAKHTNSNKSTNGNVVHHSVHQNGHNMVSANHASNVETSPARVHQLVRQLPNQAPVSNVHASNVRNTQPSTRKLPQTGEAVDASAIAAVMMLLTGISFAGVDLKRKHSI